MAGNKQINRIVETSTSKESWVNTYVCVQTCLYTCRYAEILPGPVLIKVHLLFFVNHSED